MRIISLLLSVLYLFAIDAVAQVERPVSNKEESTSTVPNRIKYPKNMMVNIMEAKAPSNRGASSIATNDCGNIGITPEELQEYEQTSTFIVNYSGFTPEAQNAFQHAVDIWSRVITAEVPIEINASFTGLGPGILGSAGPTFLFLNVPNEPFANTFYPSALADQFFGSDQAGPDISASFSSNFTNWYYGLDGCPGDNEFDFVTVVMHEIGHGLGFSGSAEVLNFAFFGTLGCYGIGLPNSSEYYPTVFDHFVESIDGSVKVTDFDPAFCWQELIDLFTGDDLVFNGPNVNACNGGSPARLYDPPFFEVGSSYSHFDENTYPEGSQNALLTPFISREEAIHNPGCATALLRDLGYNAHGFIKVVPTLGQWSMIILFLLLPILSIIAIKNKSRTLLS